MDVSDIYNFFLFWGGGKGGGARGGGRGGRFLIKIEGGGGGFRGGGAGGGRAPGECLWGGKGGAKFFFVRGRNAHQGVHRVHRSALLVGQLRAPWTHKPLSGLLPSSQKQLQAKINKNPRI